MGERLSTGKKPWAYSHHRIFSHYKQIKFIEVDLCKNRRCGRYSFFSILVAHPSGLCPLHTLHWLLLCDWQPLLPAHCSLSTQVSIRFLRGFSILTELSKILALTYLPQGFQTLFQSQLHKSCGQVLPARLLSWAVSGRESVSSQRPSFWTIQDDLFLICLKWQEVSCLLWRRLSLRHLLSPGRCKTHHILLPSGLFRKTWSLFFLLVVFVCLLGLLIFAPLLWERQQIPSLSNLPSPSGSWVPVFAMCLLSQLVLFLVYFFIPPIIWTNFIRPLKLHITSTPEA